MGFPFFALESEVISLNTESVCSSGTFGNADIDLEVTQLCKCSLMSDCLKINLAGSLR